MTTSRDPLAGVDLLLVDGSNLLHAMRGQPGNAGSPPADDSVAQVGPPAAVVGRLRGVIPAATAIQLVFDGPPERGLASARIASGIAVRYSGRRSADELILQLARDRADAGSGDGSLLVVTDDRELGGRLRRWGARVVGTSWLIGRLGRARLSSPASGRASPPLADALQPASPAQANEGDGESDRPRWKPGRGATTKRGNPRRGNPPGGKSRAGAPPWRRR